MHSANFLQPKTSCKILIIFILTEVEIKKTDLELKIKQLKFIQIELNLGAFAKLRKATIRFVMSVCPSVSPLGTTRILLDGFSWNFIFEYLSKICQENSSFIIIGQEWLVRYMEINENCSVLLRMRYVSYESCRENHSTHFMFNNFFF
jgi:hypothetical protein